jgi:hypothetical protein
MRNLIFVSVISVLVCGMALTGCVSDQEKPQDEIPASGLYVTGAAAVEGSLVKAATEPVFTGDDIVSFRVSSGEIVFAEDRIEAIMSAVERHSELYFYIDGTPVFDPAIRIHPGYGETFEDFDLQFRTLGPPTYESVKVYLTDVYMNIDTLPAAERLVKQQEMEANKARRKKELDILIVYLDAAGKIVDVPVEPPVVEPEPDLTGIKIKDNPCETLKYIRQIGRDFDTALDSLRMFKNITSEITRAPLEVIFTADDRLFYGIEYGAGKYTDVLDTKGGWYERTYKCEGEDNPDDNGGGVEPIEIPLTEYTFAGTSCQWKTSIANVISDKVIVINSGEELENYVVCAEGSYPEIDFEKHSLLLTRARVYQGISNIKERLQQLSANEFRLTIEIELNETRVISERNIAVVAEKINETSTIESDVIIIKN